VCSTVTRLEWIQSIRLINKTMCVEDLFKFRMEKFSQLFSSNHFEENNIFPATRTTEVDEEVTCVIALIIAQHTTLFRLSKVQRLQIF